MDKLDRYTCLKESSVRILEGGEDDSSSGDEEDEDDSEDEDIDEATVANDVNGMHLTEEAVIDVDEVEVDQKLAKKTQEEKVISENMHLSCVDMCHPLGCTSFTSHRLHGCGER